VKLARFGAPGAEKPALVEADGTLRDLSGVLADIDPDALSDDRLSKMPRSRSVHCLSCLNLFGSGPRSREPEKSCALV
jgi:hypothetical protein